MNVVFAIAKRFILDTFKVKSNLIWMIGMPLVFTLLFGVLPNMNTDTRMPIGVVDADHTAVSQALVSALKQDADYKVIQVPSGTEKQTLRNMKAALIVTIPGGFEENSIAHKPTTVALLPAANQAGDAGGAIAGQQKLTDRLKAWETAGQVAVVKHPASQHDDLVSTFIAGTKDSGETVPAVTVDSNVIHDGTVQSVLSPSQQSVVGFTTMFIMFTIFSATGKLLIEKRTGTWARLKLSPARRSEVIAGYALAFFLTGWIQVVVMYLSDRFLFGVSIPLNGWMVLTLSMYILAVCGIALCVAGLVRTAEQHSGIGIFVAVATCMVGGAYWPIDIEPVWMQHVAWLVPQNWAIEALRVISLGSPTLSALLWPLVVLAGFAVVFLSAGLVQLRYS